MINAIYLAALEFGFDKNNDLCLAYNNCTKDSLYIKYFNIIEYPEKVIFELIRNGYAYKVQRGIYNITGNGLKYLNEFRSNDLYLHFIPIIKNTTKMIDMLVQSVLDDQRKIQLIKSKYVDADGNLKDKLHQALNCAYTYHIDQYGLHINPIDL